ncbi:DUF790 family protein [Cuniculiplasma sp. SKW4]|uniref:DUF790 family protein n=1 Tax=Cuniculiplasma sp. SKW4 TaxID=3400171 RepID=UPI003FD29887
MFPSQLMMIRKNKSGIARSVLLDISSSDYAQSVMEVLQESTGSTYEEIEERIKDLELRSQNPKIVRGIFTVISRECTFYSYSKIPPSVLRKRVFSDPGTPVISPESREKLLEKIGQELGIKPEEIEKNLYGDLDSEKVLEKIPQMDTDIVIRKFNLEQVETALMRASSIDLKMEHSDPALLRFLGRIGLLFSLTRDDQITTLKISGPTSNVGKTERYGPLFALFLRRLLTLDGWEAEAELELGKKREKSTYTYFFNSALRDMLYIQNYSWEELPEFVSEDVKGTLVDGRQYFADYIIKVSGDFALVIISRPINLEENHSLARILKNGGKQVFVFTLLRNNEKCPSGEKCFKNRVDWYSVKEYIEKVNGKKERIIEKHGVEERKENKTEKRTVSTEVIRHLEDLYPDSYSMVDYLEFMGLDPSSVLSNLGYKIKWRGLRIEVTGKET